MFFLFFCQNVMKINYFYDILAFFVCSFVVIDTKEHFLERDAMSTTRIFDTSNPRHLESSLIPKN